jgi:conjugal transfer pilus assembly protein TraB
MVPVESGCRADCRAASRPTSETYLHLRPSGVVSCVVSRSTLDCLANYFLDMAEEIFPVIEVDAGRGIEFVLNRGATLRLGQRRT